MAALRYYHKLSGLYGSNNFLGKFECEEFILIAGEH